MSYLALGFGLIFLSVGVVVCVVPLFYLFVGGVTLGAAATGMIGRAGKDGVVQGRSESAVGSSGFDADAQSTPSTVHDGIEIT